MVLSREMDVAFPDATDHELKVSYRASSSLAVSFLHLGLCLCGMYQRPVPFRRENTKFRNTGSYTSAGQSSFPF